MDKMEDGKQKENKKIKKLRYSDSKNYLLWYVVDGIIVIVFLGSFLMIRIDNMISSQSSCRILDFFRNIDECFIKNGSCSCVKNTDCSCVKNTDCSCVKNTDCGCVKNIDCSCVKNDDYGYLLDGFALVWTLTITLLLFYLGFSTTYAYGVTIKKIIGFNFKLKHLMCLAFEYLLLCPLAYISSALGWYTTLLWCIVCSFMLFGGVLYFVVCMTRSKDITELLLRKTVVKMKQIVDGEEERVEKKQNFLKRIFPKLEEIVKKDKISLVESETYCIRQKIEELPITEMIKHLDYSDQHSVKIMIDALMTFLQFMHENELGQKVDESKFSYSIMFTWVTRIIEQSGLEKEYEQERTMYILLQIQEQVNEMLENMEKLEVSDQRERLLIYNLEIILPLTVYTLPRSQWVLKNIRDNQRVYGMHTLLYILLYMEFIYQERNVNLLQKNSALLEVIQVTSSELKHECDYWNEEMALKFWMSWSFFRKSDNLVNISKFYDYSRGVKSIRDNNIVYIHSYILRRYMLGLGEE